MSDEQMQQGQDPSQKPGPGDDPNPIEDPCDLCPNALEFIWEVSKLVEKEAHTLGQPGSDPRKSGKIIAQMMHDIRRQIKEDCPELPDGPRPEVLCSSCLPSYNSCIAGGTPPATCMSRYTTCCQNCT